jgi:WD40 repeat protein
MGVVYKSRQVSLNRTVALKMILAGAFASAREVQRFRAEAEAAAGLDHPRIVPIFEVGEHEGHQFYSMRYVEGTALAKHPRGDTRAEVDGLIAVARAVHHAHQHGVLHRDLKPSNVLVDLEGTWFVTDFGLAKRLAGADRSLTEPGQVLGTPRYMPPEQAAGRRNLTIAADVYSLGVILYERLTGQTPFSGDDALTVLRQVREEEPPRPSSIRPGLDRDLETIVLKCLDKEPGRRYESAAALADDLERWRTGLPILARPSGTLHRAWKWTRRNPMTAALSAIAVLSLSIATVISTFSAARLAVTARSLARAERSSRGLYLAAESELTRPFNPGLALALAVEAADLNPGPTANHAVLAALDENRELRTLTVADARATCLAIAPDGRTVAVAGLNAKLVGGVARLWDLNSSQAGAAISTEGTIGAARFTPDGRKLVTLSSIIYNSGWGAGFDVNPTNVRPWDINLIVWDPATGRRLVTSREPVSESVGGKITWRVNAQRAISLSPDGRRAVVTSGLYPGHPPRILDLQRGEEHARLEGHDGPVAAVAFSPDGRRIGTASVDHTARIWDAETGKELHRLVGHKCRVSDLAFSPDGGRLVTCDDRGVTSAFPGEPETDSFGDEVGRIWDVKTGALVATMRWPKVRNTLGPKFSYEQGQLGDVKSPHYNPEGTQILTLPTLSRSGGDTRHPAVWDAATGKLIRSLKREGSGADNAMATALAVSSDGRKIAIRYGDEVHLWEPSGRLVQTLRGDPRAFDDHLAFTPDALRLVSAGMDGTARVWDVRVDDEVEFARRVWPNVEQVAFSPDGRIAALGVHTPESAPPSTSANGARVKPPDWMWQIEFRDATSGRLISVTPRLDSYPYRPFRFLPDGRTLFVPLYNIARFYDVAGGRLTKSVGPGSNGPNSISDHGPELSPDGHFLAFAQTDLILYDADSGRQVWKASEPQKNSGNEPLHNPQFNPEGTKIVTAGDSTAARLWDARTGRKLATFEIPRDHSPDPERIDGAAFSPDGRRLVTVGGINKVRVWDVVSGKPIIDLVGARGWVHMAAFSPDGRRAVSWGQDGIGLIWDAEIGRELGRIDGHGGLQFQAAFSPDGQVILTHGIDRTAKLWGGTNGRLIVELAHPEGEILSGEFSPDGRLVVLSSGDNPRATRAWPVDFLTAARARCPRDLTPAERAHFELPKP